jgi:hypothetical protein
MGTLFSNYHLKTNLNTNFLPAIQFYIGHTQSEREGNFTFGILH